ncbi:TRAF-like family protein [Hirschfeldia incana]|nr:TRAF-like family protein [Hirschfeldia incana]
MGSSSTEVSTIVKNWREHPPASYSLKIHSFSQLENSTASSDDKYQSRLFSSGGYNWRLIVYPKVNKKDNGGGFISMYVEIDSKSLMVFTPPTEVFAELRFFVYNKKENKYFTIQDVEVKRFNALKTVWGLQQVLPCDTFNNPDNGYIFEGGQCEFGVDVIISPPLTNWEILSFTEEYSDPTFSCAIKNFSQFKENVDTSKSFSMGGKKWVLKLYPKGDTRADGKYLSFYLYLDDCDKPKADEKIFVQANFRVLDPLGSNHFKRKLEKWYTEQHPAWGWPEFLSKAELQKAYLDKQDTLKVEIEFTVVSATKYSPIT